MKTATPKTADGLCAPTLTTRQNCLGVGNLISVAKHPHGGGNILGTMQIVVPKLNDEKVACTLMASYGMGG